MRIRGNFLDGTVCQKARLGHGLPAPSTRAVCPKVAHGEAGFAARGRRDLVWLGLRRAQPLHGVQLTDLRTMPEAPQKLTVGRAGQPEQSGAASRLRPAYK